MASPTAVMEAARNCSATGPFRHDGSEGRSSCPESASRSAASPASSHANHSSSDHSLGSSGRRGRPTRPRLPTERMHTISGVVIEEADEQPEDEARSHLGLVFHPNFGPFLLGNLLSNCGTWFQNIAQALLIYRLTGSTLLVGVVNFAQFAGVFVLAPWSGTGADRFDRRRLLIVTQLFAVAITALLATLSAAGLAPAGVIILLAFVLGLTTAFAIPALQALVPLLVTKSELPAAIAINSVSFTLARAIGPALGAIVVHSLGIPAAFACNSVSYLALIAGLLIIHPAPQAER